MGPRLGPMGPYGPPLSSHGIPMGAQGVPLGAHGALWAPPELPWDSHGGPKGPHGPQRPKTFIFLRFSPPFSGQMCQNHGTVINFVASRNSEADPPDPPDPADPPETQHFGQNRPWVPHARGHDYGSLHKLLQIII